MMLFLWLMVMVLELLVLCGRVGLLLKLGLLLWVLVGLLLNLLVFVVV